MSEKRIRPEFEKRRALVKFKTLATQDAIEAIADDLFIYHRDSPQLAEIAKLTEIFETSDREDLDHYFVGAIRRRDAEFLNLVADVMHDEQNRSNPKFQIKLDAIATGSANPALRPVG